MGARKVGERVRLQLYERALARYRRPTFVLTCLLLALWFVVVFGYVVWPPEDAAPWLLSGAVVSLATWLFVWIGPQLAYVQPRQDHLRLQTPIYRLKVSYRRIHNTRPVNIARMFPPSKLKVAQQRLLEPFYGSTALGVDLHGYPIHPLLLRLFLNRFMLAADQPGLVLLVSDWMALSNQLSSLTDAWRSAQQLEGQDPISDAAAILATPSRRKPWWRFW